ncbi:MAG: DUF1036 domain-containing protein [Epsilonproteobacteria bacterium]|nr:DUF1036 domain-containing protein [Campylobacterota bacterium]
MFLVRNPLCTILVAISLQAGQVNLETITNYSDETTYSYAEQYQLLKKQNGNRIKLGTSIIYQFTKNDNGNYSIDVIPEGTSSTFTILINQKHKDFEVLKSLYKKNLRVEIEGDFFVNMNVLGIPELYLKNISYAEALNGLVICNKTKNDVFSAVAYGVENDKMTSTGWYEIKANQCDSIINAELELRYYYVYAESDNLKWSGEYSFCVKDDQFELTMKPNDHGNAIKCKLKDLKSYSEKFEKIDVGEAKHFTYTLTN